MKSPDSWIETTVGKVIIDMQPGFAQRPGDEDSGSTPQIRTHNVSPDGKITLDGIKHVTVNSKEVEKYRLKKGDVVFNNTNSDEWVGKTAVFDQEGVYVFSNHMTRLRTNEELILPEYLAAYLHLLWAKGYSKTRAKRWVSQAGIEGATLLSYKLPLPLISEQWRIVDLLKQAECIGTLRNKAQDIVDKLSKQRFAELFGHPAENPKNFDCFTLDQFGSLDRGQSKHRPRDASHLFGGPYPFIQTGEVANAGDWITNHKSTYSEAGLAQSKLWPKGTLCITIAANIAKAAILEFDACFPDSVVGFTPFEGISSEYVLYCLRFYQEYFEHKAPKAAQMNINLETLRSLRIPKPPESLQLDFADFVRQVRLLNQATTQQFEKHNELLNELKISAFSGELTKSWREANSEEIAAAVAERDELLHKITAKPNKANAPDNQTQSITAKTVRAKTRDSAPPQLSKPVEHGRPARHWLLNELSEFQAAVWTMLCHEWPQKLVIVDDPEAFNDFCTNEQTTWPIEHFNPSPNRIRRTLEQLAALGLIAKVSVPRQNAATQQTEYLTAFRPVREDENSRLRDAAILKGELNKNEQSDASRRNSDKWGSW